MVYNYNIEERLRMKRTQLIEKGDYVEICNWRCEFEPLVKERLEANYKRLSKERNLTLDVVKQADIFYIVTGTEEKKNKYGDKEFYIKIGIGDDITSVPAISVHKLHRKEMLDSKLACSVTIISFLNYSNFINKRWLLTHSIMRSQVHDSYSMVIPYHMMKTENWKSIVSFYKKRNGNTIKTN